MAPVIGVFVGAFAHFAVQLPLAAKMGFKFTPRIEITHDLKKIGRLALPRVIEVAFLQFSKLAELFFASLISTASYTYYTFGNTLQLLPVGLFGTSIAKAALPTLSYHADDMEKFGKTLFKSLQEMVFLITPLATMLVVLRIPVVRLVYGTDIFTWEATVQTGWVVSAFAVGIVFQAANALLSRAFYALHDTKTPVVSSIISILIIIVLDFLFIRVFAFRVWGLAAAFSIGSFIQTVSLFYLINKRINGSLTGGHVMPFIKFLISALGSGSIMFLIKTFPLKSLFWIPDTLLIYLCLPF